MEEIERNKFLDLEFWLSAALIFLLIPLFDELIEPVMKLSVVSGVILGFFVSWSSRSKSYQKQIKNITFACSIATLAWCIYSVLKSSLLYKEVLLIFADAVFILVIFLSFGALIPELLGYIQILSMALFLIACALIHKFDVKFYAAAGAYVFIILAVMRIKLYGYFRPAKEKKVTLHSYYLPLFFFFLLIVFISWTLASRFPLAKIKPKGIFLDEDFQTGDAKEKEYRDKKDASQEKMQGEVTSWIMTLKITQEKQDMIMQLSTLVQESSGTTSVAEAEEAILYSLKSRALSPGQAKINEETASLVSEYAGTKADLKLTRIQNNMVDVLKTQPFNLMERSRVVDALNKMRSSDSYKDILDGSKELQKIINSSHFNEAAKKELNKLSAGFFDWKAYKSYRKQLDLVREQTKNLRSFLGNEADNIIQRVNNMKKNVSGSEAIRKDIKAFTQKLSSQDKQAGAGLEELLDLKSAMAGENLKKELENKLAGANFPEDKLGGLKNDLESISNTEDPGKSAKAFSQLKDKLMEDGALRNSPEVKEIIDDQLNKQIEKARQRIENKAEGINRSDLGKQLRDSLDNMNSSKDKGGLISVLQKIGQTLEEASRQGLVSKGQKDDLNEEAGNLSGLLSARLEMNEAFGGGKNANDSQTDNYKKEISRLLSKNQRVGAINKLMEKLNSANTISQVEDMRQSLKQEIESSLREGSGKQESQDLNSLADKMCDAKKSFIVEQANYNMRKKIDELAEIEPLKAQALKARMDKLKKSQSENQVAEALEAMESEAKKTETEGRQSDQQEVSLIKKKMSVRGKQGFLKMYIIPAVNVLQFNSTIALKCVAVFDNNKIKDLSQELEWVSTNPSVVAVDSKGVVYALGKGSAKVFASYDGIASEKSEIIVVESIQDNLSEAVMREIEE